MQNCWKFLIEFADNSKVSKVLEYISYTKVQSCSLFDSIFHLVLGKDFHIFCLEKIWILFEFAVMFWYLKLHFWYLMIHQVKWVWRPTKFAMSQWLRLNGTKSFKNLWSYPISNVYCEWDIIKISMNELENKVIFFVVLYSSEEVTVLLRLFVKNVLQSDINWAKWCE